MLFLLSRGKPVESQNVAQTMSAEAGPAANSESTANLSPDTSKLPVVERKTDHLNTIVTTICVVTFLPLPLLLAFGLKSFLWMGIIICVVAVIRLINSPVQLPKPAPPVTDSVSAAMRQPQAVRESGSQTSSPPR